MSEHEFENWLALLSGLLKLSPEQRRNIADELRSHLEERMEDLIDAGASREEAIAAALAEFGDTAALAHHFTSIAHQKRRRLMRYTYGTIAAVTCAILVLATFWPGPNGPVMPNVVAQSEPEVAEGGASTLGTDIPVVTKSGNATSDPFAGSREKIEAKLAEPCEAEYFQMPLEDVLEDLSQRLEITIFCDPEEVGDVIDLSVPIEFKVGPDTMSGKTLLEEFILGPNDLVYTIRDNFLMISSYGKSLTKYEIVAYDCRDLISKDGSFLPVDVKSDLLESDIEPAIEKGGGAPGDEAPFYFGGPVSPSFNASMSPEQQLQSVIQLAIRSEDSPWDDGAGGSTDENVGTMSVIKGLLVVRQTRAVHDQIEQLLKLLRKGIEERDQSSTTH